MGILENQNGKNLKLQESHGETLESMDGHLCKIAEGIETLVKQSKAAVPTPGVMVLPVSQGAPGAKPGGAVGVKAMPVQPGQNLPPRTGQTVSSSQ